MIHNPQMECMSREDMRKLQSERLVATVKRCYETVPFYKRKMDELGVKPEDIKSIDDVTKLPFTTKYDLRDEYPFGLQAVPMDQITSTCRQSAVPVSLPWVMSAQVMWFRSVMATASLREVLVPMMVLPSLAPYSCPPRLATPRSKS